MTDEQFTYLTTKYIDTVFRVALSWMKHPSEAEDVTQTVFLKLYREPKRSLEKTASMQAEATSWNTTMRASWH